MFKRRSKPIENTMKHIPAPIGGFDASSLINAMRLSNAPLLDNWFPAADGLTMRDGYTDHITAIPKKCDRLHVYSGTNGTESLWGSTDDGIYAFTTAGACPAASIALTNGKTFSTAISTGAGSYMLVCNGTDTIKQYDGAAWTAIATFGATATSIYSYIETYRQRIFLIKKSSLEIEYLAANSIAGATTNYPLGAIFRKGGYLVAMSVWTVDGGVGPEDNLAIISSKGEVAVFAGNDPATWNLRGVYFAGVPLGDNPMYKSGGDVLIITESGIVALTSLLQSVAFERSPTVSQTLRPFLVAAGIANPTTQGWQIFGHPSLPGIFVNIPSTIRQQAVMNTQTGAWATYTGWNALAFARKATGGISELYFSSSDDAANTWKVKRVTGHADNGANITATMLQAYSLFGAEGNKKVEEIRGYFESSSAFLYNMGVASDFTDPRELTQINVSTGLSAAIWGTSLWGTAIWTGSNAIVNDWQGVPDEYSQFKALYVQVVSRLSAVRYLGADILYKAPGSHF